MNRNLRRAITSAPILAMILSGAALTGTAGATPSSALPCGSVITQSTKLGNDVGPCATDGLIIAADKVKLDLDGHKVFGANAPGGVQGAAGQNVGIRFRNVSGSEVRNGEVSNFAAGVRLDGGSSNTVGGLYAHDNIGPLGTNDNGDGIAAWNSSYNMIENNRVVRNGPFSGIALVTGPYNVFSDPAITATGNKIRSNQVLNNNVAVCTSNAGCFPRDPNTGQRLTTSVPRGALTTGSLDAGIRIEGPNETFSEVERNVIKDSGIDGIFVMASCHNAFMPNPTGAVPCQGDVGDSGTLIKDNQSDHNGYGGGDGSGINLWAMLGLPGVLPATFNTVVGNTARFNYSDGINLYSTCSPGNDPARCATNNNDIFRNTLTDNRRDGIRVAGGSMNNRINQNTVQTNGNIGVELKAGAFNNILFSNQGSANVVFDGADYNLTPPCDNNDWEKNEFTTVNQPCVLDSGTTPASRPGNAPGNGYGSGIGDRKTDQVRGNNSEG